MENGRIFLSLSYSYLFRKLTICFRVPAILKILEFDLLFEVFLEFYFLIILLFLSLFEFVIIFCSLIIFQIIEIWILIVDSMKVPWNFVSSL